MDTLYNEDEYDFAIGALAAVIRKRDSNYKYIVAYNVPGSYEITVKVSSKDKKKGIEMKSDPITVTIK